MSLDFSAILVIGLGLALAILAANRLIFSRGHASVTAMGGSVNEGSAWLAEQVRSLLPVLLFVLVVRSFVFEPFRIPSASMMPGLVDGDFIIVNKFSYGLRLPWINTKVVAVGDPERGDVVVFRLPSDPSVHYIKRLVGLPGDHVVVRHNQVIINGVPAPQTPHGLYSGGYGFSGAPVAMEKLGTSAHQVMFAPDLSSTDFEATVPPHRYFFMGDNRNDSQDSRFAAVGFVPEQNLVGHATRIWMNFRPFQWPVWSRIGEKIS